MARDIDAILASAVETLLWSEMITVDPEGGTQAEYAEENGISDGDPFDDHFGPEDLSPETIAELRSDIEGFLDLEEVKAALDALDGACGGHACSDSAVRLDDSAIGHNFVLTRNRHGAGFWDLGLGEHGDTLTKWAHTFGTIGLMLGDDGKVYHHD